RRPSAALSISNTSRAPANGTLPTMCTPRDNQASCSDLPPYLILSPRRPVHRVLLLEVAGVAHVIMIFLAHPSAPNVERRGLPRTAKPREAGCRFSQATSSNGPR